MRLHSFICFNGFVVELQTQMFTYCVAAYWPMRPMWYAKKWAIHLGWLQLHRTDHSKIARLMARVELRRMTPYTASADSIASLEN